MASHQNGEPADSHQNGERWPSDDWWVPLTNEPNTHTQSDMDQP